MRRLWLRREAPSGFLNNRERNVCALANACKNRRRYGFEVFFFLHEWIATSYIFVPFFLSCIEGGGWKTTARTFTCMFHLQCNSFLFCPMRLSIVSPPPLLFMGNTTYLPFACLPPSKVSEEEKGDRMKRKRVFPPTAHYSKSHRRSAPRTSISYFISRVKQNMCVSPAKRSGSPHMLEPPQRRTFSGFFCKFTS